MKLLRIAVIAALAAPLPVLATTGYFQHGYGLKAKGMGGVGIALPQDAIAAASNPAGMAFVGNRLDLGLDWFRPIRDSEIVGNGLPAPLNLNGSFDGSGKKNYYIPEFGWNRMVRPDLALGVSVFGNGGMNTTYDRSPFAPLGGSSPAGVDLVQLFISPTIAYKLNERHAIGLSINLAYQVFSADGLQPFDNPFFSSSPGNVTNRGDDHATGWGARIGWTGRITDSVTLGATYQTKTRMSKFDKYKGLFAEQGDFDIPENYGAGIAWKVTPQWTLAGDIEQISYSKVKAVGNPIDCLFAGTCQLGASNGAGFGWRDTTVYKLGVSYEWSKALTLRAGYVNLRQPIPSSQTLINIVAPGVVEDHLTLGATWTFDANKELTVGYMHAFKKKVSGSGSIPAALGGGEVNLQMYQDSLGVAFGWKM